MILKAVKDMTYPGRMIIIGRDAAGTFDIVAYAITGRSPASQARKFEFSGGRILVKPTDEETLSRGDPELLIYPAVAIGLGISVSNGKQTTDIMMEYERGRGPVEVLETGLRYWTFEPDAPHFTPRIGGFVLPGSDTAALGILKSGKQGETLRNFFEFPLQSGRGRMIATYAGDNTNPLPSFRGEPYSVEFEGIDEREIAEDVYHALGPAEGDDFRVAVGVVLIDKDETRHHIINRCEGGI